MACVPHFVLSAQVVTVTTVSSDAAEGIEGDEAPVTTTIKTGGSLEELSLEQREKVTC